MSWICSKCETENPDRLGICEVCDTPREVLLIEFLEEKYGAPHYKTFLRTHARLMELADKGNANAQFKVGEWFKKNSNASNTIAYNRIAFFWYKNAAMQGHALAMEKLGECYEKGECTKISLGQAKIWYKNAAEKGNHEALRRYIRLKYNSDVYQRVIKYRMQLLEAADSGDLNAQFLLGEWLNNDHTLSANGEESVSWYKKAANSGHAEASRKLGDFYESGIYVKISMTQAIKWYRNAAREGDMLSSTKLVRIFLYGIKTKKDVLVALKYQKLYGVSLSRADIYNIGYAYDTGDTVPMDKVKAVSYYKEAAKQGDVVAQFNLGVCYENGSGVKQDVFLSKFWYEKAALQGYERAKQCEERINSLVRYQKRKKFITDLFCSLVVGCIWGAMVFFALIEVLPKSGIHIPVVWLNAYPINLLLCLIFGVVITYILSKL